MKRPKTNLKDSTHVSESNEANPLGNPIPLLKERPVTPDIDLDLLLSSESVDAVSSDVEGSLQPPVTPMVPQFGTSRSMWGVSKSSPVLNHMRGDSHDSDADFMCFTLDLPQHEPQNPQNPAYGTELSSFPPPTSPTSPRSLLDQEPTHEPLASGAFDPSHPPPTWSSLIAGVLNSSINRDADMDYALKGMVSPKAAKCTMRRVVSDGDIKNSISQAGDDLSLTSRLLFSTPPRSSSSPSSKGKKKRVSFNESVTIYKFCKHYQDASLGEVKHSDLWWSNEDYSVFKQALLFRAHLGFPGEDDESPIKQKNSSSGRFKVCSI
ncbi:hypothetical protein TrST_g3751 [Triparma strigata]|uniref:Uncharacterized protein n=1 Tax=Triparma strigata TaxID=1606541 RepID=A0A9W7EPA5_9STRA|nr:hypothetical protein TrST_g3751 [Triparma strigata]